MLRGRYSFLIILAITLTGLMFSFQNCAPPPAVQNNSDEDGIVHKIDVESGASTFSVFDSGVEGESKINLVGSLPSGTPLVLIVRNGQLYPGAQIIVNGKSLLLTEYLDLLDLFSASNFTVPIFYTSDSEGEVTEESALETLKEIKLDFTGLEDHSRFCLATQEEQHDPLNSDLILQIADAGPLLEGKVQQSLRIYWSMPLRVFSPSVCASP